MKLIGASESEVLTSRVSNLSLDELFEIANEIGELKTGGFRSNVQAEINIRNVGEDFIIVKSQHYQTLKENIQECIERSRKIINFYNTL